MKQESHLLGATSSDAAPTSEHVPWTPCSQLAWLPVLRRQREMQEIWG